MAASEDQLFTELRTEAVLNYERITALYQLLEDKGLLAHDEFEAAFKKVHQDYEAHMKAIFGETEKE